MKPTIFAAVVALVGLAAAGCGPRAAGKGRASKKDGPFQLQPSLLDARKGFTTTTRPAQDVENSEPEAPPEGVFRLVRYPAPVGECAAYLSVAPADGTKRPAIVWITGGDCNAIGDVWSESPPENDQTAAAFRKAGVVMLFPSLRGGNRNPGQREGFFGEVDDVLASADFLSQQEGIDPGRIYLGGHSTGGTLVALVAAASDRFRAVFSFGPVERISSYGGRFAPFDQSNPREESLRSPQNYMASVRSRLLVIEGTGSPNHSSLQSLGRASNNPLVTVHPVPGAGHFDVLARVNKVLAAKVLADTGPKTNLTLTAAELAGGGP